MKKIGFVIADDNEYKPFSDFALSQGGKEKIRRGRQSVEFTLDSKELIGVKSGIGKVNSATAGAFLIADDSVDCLISFGLSGAISSLSRGDIVAGTSYVECDFDLTPLGYPLGKKPQEAYVYEADPALLAAALNIPGVKPASCGCGDLFLADKEKKQLYKETFGIQEFDMETGAVASVCHDAGVPFIAIRQISDTADDAATESYTVMNDLKDATLTETVLRLVKSL